MMGADPVANKIGKGRDISRCHRSRSIRYKSECTACAPRKFVTGVAVIEEIEPSRSAQRCDSLTLKGHQCSATDEQGEIRR